jgi:hypothetical protein
VSSCFHAQKVHAKIIPEELTCQGITHDRTVHLFSVFYLKQGQPRQELVVMRATQIKQAADYFRPSEAEFTKKRPLDPCAAKADRSNIGILVQQKRN